jgi:polyisoprenoid-binding protein YceI
LPEKVENKSIDFWKEKKKMKLIKILFVVIFSLTTGAAAFGQHAAQNPCGDKAGMKFTVNDPTGRNSVTFKSTAPLEDIVGTSRDITGYVMFDPNDPANGGYGEFKVSVASLETGIPLRDEHLRSEAWMNADQYPYITFKIYETRDVKEVKTAAGYSTYDATLVGDFSFHGVTRKIEFPGRFTYLKESEKTQQRLPGDLLAGRASFEIALKDYGVTGPPGMGIIGSKVGEVITVEVSFMGNSQPMMAEGASNPCGDKAMNPCGDKAANPCGEKASNPCGGKAMNPCASR